jgi:hypothetical protein
MALRDLFLAYFSQGSARARCAASSALLVLLAACTKTEAPAVVSVAPDAGRDAQAAAPVKPLEHCNMIGSGGTCVEYTTKDEVGLRRKLCEEFKTTFAEGPCTRANLVGTCVLDGGQITNYYNRVASKDWGYTQETAQRRCESDLLKGKFTAVGKP